MWPRGGQRQRVREQVLADLRAAEHELGRRLLAGRHVGLDGVRERVDAGVRGHDRRRADRQQRVADRVARDQVAGSRRRSSSRSRGSVMTATGVASEPVPAVVGSAISGTIGPGHGLTA